MGLKLTLKPNEKVIVNGCIIRNADRRQTLTIENQADVIRGVDLLDGTEEATPTKEVYFLVQSALLRPDLRDELTPIVQKRLAKLVPVFHVEIGGHLIEAANHVSARNYYHALKAIQPVIEYEAKLLGNSVDLQTSTVAAE